MANAKRASMREGPLAALFRKTEDGELPDASAEQREPSTTAKAKTKRAKPTADSKSSSAGSPSSPSSDVPHPALKASGTVQDEPPRIPTPQERLRHAFSSEIPENVMDRPVAPADVYAREESYSFGVARPVTQPLLRVVGVGGAGVNAINRMVEAEVAGVEFLAINTDLQSLQQSTADITLHIGQQVTRGLGSGSDASLGRQAAMDEYDKIKALLKGSDMIFITAGAGGGTGTGAAPIVARIAREVGALTVAIVTKPFGFEGSRRSEQADAGVQALASEVDTLIVVPNNRL
jgi:cell division protein FtsZ